MRRASFPGSYKHASRRKDSSGTLSQLLDLCWIPYVSLLSEQDIKRSSFT